MNPRSVWIYIRRHKRQAGLLLGLSLIVTVGLYALVGLVWGVFVDPGRMAYMCFSEFSLVTPTFLKNSPDPALHSQLDSNPDIAKIIPSKFIRVQLAGMIPGQGFQFDLIALLEADTTYLLERFGATLVEGRLLRPGAAELVLTEDLANMLDVKVGDSYIVKSFEFYVGMETAPDPTPFVLVGILNSDIELGLLSLAFLNRHNQFRQLPERLIVVAQEGHKNDVDHYLRSEILSTESDVMTHEMLNKRILNEALPGLIMLFPVVLLVSVAFSLMIVGINYLANIQRMPEFGILHAVGLSKRWLINRLTKETTVLALTGWLLGILCGFAALYLLKLTVFADGGYDLNYPLWLPIGFSSPVPLVITGFTFLMVRRLLTRLDTVSIIERRELGQEANQQKSVLRSSTKPLTAITYYRRHQRRVVLTVSAMGLMILSIVLFLFTLAIGSDAKEPFLDYLKHVSIVRSAEVVESLDPDVFSQIKDHPAVDRVIPLAPRFSMLSVYIPPFNNINASPFGIYAADMNFLVELFGLELLVGRLPQPGTNEVVIPESLARNRRLEVGDVIGDPNDPAYPNAPSLETEFVITGIFAQPTTLEGGSGLGFLSLEYLENQEAYDIPAISSLMVVPKAGAKALLDDWLLEELAGENISVLTYHQEIARIQNQVQQDLGSIVLLEALIVTVAAIGLAVLNHFFIAQRRSEFGLLHAIGYTCKQLIGCVFWETSLMIALAWSISAILALSSMGLVHMAIFEPRGLNFDLFNFTPWFYTLPIPVFVLVITTVTTAWTLAKVDAVSIIEQR